MKLKGIKYKEPKAKTKLVFPKEEVKSLIKEFVKEDEAKGYGEIVHYVLNHYYAEGKHFHSDDVLVAIKEVDAEWHPPEVVEIVGE